MCKIFEEAARGTVLSAGALEGLMMTFEKDPYHVDE